jgi:hypothetical protein
MNNPFLDASKTIANDFLQSIVFIDDRAYLSTENAGESKEIRQHDFDALNVTRAFAKSQKICAVYKPESLSDIDNLILLAKKADITVIDWQIRISEQAAENENEQDAENDDPRGPHTRRIIREILSDPLTGSGSLKLILVYTGELVLHDITDSIFDDLKKVNIEGLQKATCKVFTDNIKILVVAKPSVDTAEDAEPKFKHNPELNSKIVKYEDLPEFILNEFTQMTSGLLSNFVLKSLTILRQNTFRLVKLYDNSLDSSFLVHRLLLPNQEDSKEQMVEVFSDSLHGLLSYNHTGETLSTIEILKWVDLLNVNYELNFSEKTFSVNTDLVKKFFTQGLEDTLKALWSEKGYGEMAKNTLSNFEKKIHQKGMQFLVPESQDASKFDSEFSILTHHKSNLKQPSSSPRMSLGTVIKEKKVDSPRYYICIQARCDSVRLRDERRFLFVPLVQSSGAKFHVVVNEGNYLKLQIKPSSFELRTIKFRPAANGDSITAIKNDTNEFVFASIYGEEYVWVCDLKDLHSQRIATDYAYQLSRVGLDESEWLRRYGA